MTSLFIIYNLLLLYSVIFLVFKGREHDSQIKRLQKDIKNSLQKYDF